MRAIFLKDMEIENIVPGEILNLTDHQFHHLKKVVRIEKGEKILGLNGKGLELILQYESDSNKSLQMSIIKCTLHSPVKGPKVAIGILKKEGMEEVLKLSVEMGIEKIIFLNTQYSQRGLSFSAFGDRYFRIMEGALLQSNNIFFPHIEGPLDFEDFLHNISPDCALFCYGLNNASESRNAGKDLPNQGLHFSKIITLIGPEGGLTPEEEAKAMDHPNSFFFKLPMPILRAPHAMSVARGHVIGLYSPLKGFVD